MALNSDEIKYYLRFLLKRPARWGTASAYVWKRIALRIADRIHALPAFSGSLYHYPETIRREVREISIPDSPTGNWIDDLPSTGWAPGEGHDIDAWPIPLATHSVAFKDLNWFRDEADEEDAYALHRFIWLLRWLAQVPSTDALPAVDRMMLDWIEKVDRAKNGLAWTTYSVSERVVNWLLFFCATKNHRNMNAKAAGMIGAALFEHLKYIMTHLEYYGGSYNNHILNNARALYLGGRFMLLPQVAHLGENLFRRCLPCLVNDEGTLLEGSSHYQLLLTRMLVEVSWAANVSGDTDFAKWIEKVASSMVSCCFYLGGEYPDNLAVTFPRVGDVSPDYPVAWFYPHPDYGHKAESWNSLWKIKPLPSRWDEAGREDHPAVTFKHWKRVAAPHGSFKVLIHTPESPRSYPTSHGHLDFGGFLLDDAEGPVLVDRGRISYRPDDGGGYGFSARSHNTTLINGSSIIPDCRGIFAGYNEYLSRGTAVGIHDGGLEKVISWRSDALERLGKGLKWRRDLVLRQDRTESLETVSNPRGIALAVESYIHWAPGWTMLNGGKKDSDEFFIGKEGRAYRLKIEFMPQDDAAIEWFVALPDSQGGWHFPDYGVRIPALTIRLALRSVHDCSVKFLLRPI